MAALFYNLSSKSYLSGLAEFSAAWANNDPGATARWLRGTVGSLFVPNLVTSLNPDPIYRDVRSVMDNVISRIPGWSTTLDPKFNIFGEPVMKTPGLANRNQIFTTKAVTHNVESDLLSIGKGLAPLSPAVPETNGLVNLQDRNAFDNGTHVSPYIRMMALIRSPENGMPPMREAMVELVHSDEWQQSSDGTSLFPGGRRWLLAAGVKQRYEGLAFQQVLEEYPKLRQQIMAVRRIKGAAIQSGEQGVSDIENLFGVSPTQGR